MIVELCMLITYKLEVDREVGESRVARAERLVADITATNELPVGGVITEVHSVSDYRVLQ